MFKLLDDEEERATTWMKGHIPSCKYYDKDRGIQYVGAMGGAFSYKFTPTSLGTIVSVECACGESEVVTSFDDW